MLKETHNSPTATDYNANIDADIAGIRFRDPVIDKEIDTETIERPWQLVTEVARRAILTNPETRKVAEGFSLLPVSEQLPRQAVEELSLVSPHVKRVSKLTEKTLGILNLPSVPDAAIGSNLTMATGRLAYGDAEDARYRLLAAEDADEYQQYLTELNEQHATGISWEEAELVLERSKMAGDIKLLGLTAELIDQPPAHLEPENGLVRHTLASGTKLVMTEQAFASTPALLNPQTWEKREQIKDRVFSVAIDGREYVMKEHKTNRHRDTIDTDSVSSQEEFETAEHFADLGVIEGREVQLRWENPLGYVEFPDGYEFSIFDSVPDLEIKPPSAQLTQQIVASRERYEAEYREVIRGAQRIYEERPDLLSRFKYRIPNLPDSQPYFHDDESTHKYVMKDGGDLTYEQFAGLKAGALFQEAQDFLRTARWDEGYINEGYSQQPNSKENDGFGFRVRDSHPFLEIVGFDFEYYVHAPQEANAMRRRYAHDRRHQNIYKTETITSRLLSMLETATGQPVEQSIITAAAYSLLERSGIRLPSKEMVEIAEKEEEEFSR